MTTRLVRRVNAVIMAVLATGGLAGALVARELAPVSAEAPVAPAERPAVFGDLFEHKH